MKRVQLLLLVLIACLNAQEIAPISQSPLVQYTNTHARAGVITALSQTFFQNFKDIVLQSFVDNVSKIEFPTISKVIPVKLFDLNLTAHNFRLADASVDIANTELVIKKDDPQIYAKVKDITFVFDFDYNITTEPEFVQDIGHAQITIENLTGEMAGDPVVKFDNDQQRNAYNVDIQMAKFSCDNFTLNMEGGDVAELVNDFKGISSDYLREFILRSFNEPMRHALANLINRLLLKPKDLILDAPVVPLSLNYSLVDEGVHVSDYFMSAIFDGSVYDKDQEHEPAKKMDYNYLPFYEQRGRDLQVMISEHTINSILKSVVGLDDLEIDGKRVFEKELNVTTDYINSIIADFDGPYGEKDNVTVVFRPTPLEKLSEKYHPEVNIEKDEVWFKLRCDLHIKNPYDSSIDAMVLTVELKSYIKFSLNEEFKLFCEVEDADVTLLDVKAYFKTSATTETLNHQLDWVAKTGFAFGVNQAFKHGISLPVPDYITAFLKDPRARHFNGFLFLDAEIDFNGAVDDVIKLIDQNKPEHEKEPRILTF